MTFADIILLIFTIVFAIFSISFFIGMVVFTKAMFALIAYLPTLEKWLKEWLEIERSKRLK